MKNWQLLTMRLEPRIEAVCYARHAKLQDQATRDDPEWQQQYEDFVESEIQNATFAMLQFFDPDSYLEQAETFAEEEKKAKAKKAKQNKKQKAQMAAVEKCHDLGLKVWDPAALTKWDGAAGKACWGRQRQETGDDLPSRSAIEEFLQTEEGQQVLHSMEYEKTGGEGGVRELLAIESDKYQAAKRRADKLESAVRAVQTVGTSILAVIKAVAQNIPIQEEWVLAFDRQQPADSPMRPRAAASSARSQSSDGGGSTSSTSRRLALPPPIPFGSRDDPQEAPNS